jgi:ribosomal protein L7Ae-like RNA K-turn-binding protein
MTIVELKRALDSKKLKFGLKEVLKDKPEKVFLACDAREDVEKKIKDKGVEVSRLREDKEKIAKDLRLGFLSEVYSIGEKKQKKKEEPSKRKRTSKKKDKEEKKE